MCCFASPVTSVTDTNLFARLTSRGTQMLAYQMTYESEQPNAMILPLPVSSPAREASLRFFSLEHYESFFEDLDRGFPARPRPTSDLSASGRVLKPTDSKLVVHKVGNYVASFVPRMNDFSRLDQRFVIPKSSWDKIPHYADYSFAVFQLEELNGKPHPMAFEFKTRLTDEIFFPTVHIHDGKVHEQESFDHTLYLQNPRFDEVVGDYVDSYVKDSRTGFVRSKETADKFCKTVKTKGMVSPDHLVHRIKMVGTFTNKDVLASVSPKESGATGYRLGQILPSAPGMLGSSTLLGAAGFSWLIGRRNQISASNSKTV